MHTTPAPELSLEPRERRWLARTPTRAMRRFLWDRIKHRRIQATVRTVFGARMACDTRDFIQRYVYYFGIWEPNLSAFVPSRLAAGDVFVDVGANVGYFSLLAARAVAPAGNVVAIEPEPGIRARLEHNLQLNDERSVRVLGEACTDSERELRLIFGGDHNTGGTSAVAAATGERGQLIRGRPLFDQLLRAERERARLIKIDVEGAEFDVLKGLHLERAGFRHDLELVVEIAPERIRARGHDPQELFVLMTSLGFNSYLLENDYRARAYLGSPPPRRPVRTRTAPATQTDVVFSRVDATEL